MRSAITQHSASHSSCCCIAAASSQQPLAHLPWSICRGNRWRREHQCRSSASSSGGGSGTTAAAAAAVAAAVAAAAATGSSTASAHACHRPVAPSPAQLLSPATHPKSQILRRGAGRPSSSVFSSLRSRWHTPCQGAWASQQAAQQPQRGPGTQRAAAAAACCFDHCPASHLRRSCPAACMLLLHRRPRRQPAAPRARTSLWHHATPEMSCWKK